jgi:hypothetical protein
MGLGKKQAFSPMMGMIKMRVFQAVAIDFLALSAVVGPAVGQAEQKQAGSPDTKVSPQAATVTTPAQPKLTPPVEQLLRALEGTWSIKEKLAPDATSPNGTTGEGRIVWRSGPGRFSVIEDYQSEEGNRESAGLAVFWWDEAAQGYHNVWCDSTNPGGCINFKSVARWEGAQLQATKLTRAMPETGSQN